MTHSSVATNPRRIALVGIDGCGKSSVIAQLREMARDAPGSFRSITCPSFHDTPDAPFQELSRCMKAFSDATDVVGSLEAKVIALYLQMTLYGPVERFFVDTFHPSVLVCERHPIVESFVYGPFYVHLGRGEWGGTDIEARIRGVVDRDEPGSFDAVLAWLRDEAARLGHHEDVWQLLTDIAAMAKLDFATMAATLERHYRTTVPDTVLWLDLPPDQAEARCRARSGGGLLEMHETTEFLAMLRDGYAQAHEQFADAFPHIGFHVIDTSDSVGLADSVRACVEEAKIFA
jgi:hypothetical protein